MLPSPLSIDPGDYIYGCSCSLRYRSPHLGLIIVVCCYTSRLHTVRLPVNVHTRSPPTVHGAYTLRSRAFTRCVDHSRAIRTTHTHSCYVIALNYDFDLPGYDVHLPDPRSYIALAHIHGLIVFAHVSFTFTGPSRCYSLLHSFGTIDRSVALFVLV